TEDALAELRGAQAQAGQAAFDEGVGELVCRTVYGRVQGVALAVGRIVLGAEGTEQRTHAVAAPAGEAAKARRESVLLRHTVACGVAQETGRDRQEVVVCPVMGYFNAGLLEHVDVHV